jgi:hypothetical protein
LGIDAVLVHEAKPRFDVLVWTEKRAIERRRAAVWNGRFGVVFEQVLEVNVTVGVNVDRMDAATSNDHVPTLCGSARLSGGSKRATETTMDETKSSGSAGKIFQEFSAVRHVSPVNHPRTLRRAG